VKEEYRRKGLGESLYEDATRIARNLGFKKIVIDIFEANTNSLKFHQKLKFKQVYSIYEKKI